ncbi:MAG: response regulator [Planctomycetota bacterium]|jgi:CheY-like chemotaxis protein
MTLSRPRLVLLPGETPLEASLLDWLRTAFDVVQIDDPAALNELAGDDSAALVVCAPRMLQGLRQALPPESAVNVLQHIGEGVGVVDAAGVVTWANARLRDYDEPTRQQFAELCGRALELLNDPEPLDAPVEQRTSRKFSFRSGEHHFELVASPAATEPGDDRRVTAVVGVLWDVTSGRRLLDKLDAIDAAGSELMKIEAESIATLSMTDRLKLLEEKIVHYVHDLLHFDDFEIRLIDPDNNRLELVMAVGITPERIGEVLYPERHGSGISGYVAETGESYLCSNVKADPLYREGLDDAASALTVPLRLHDRIIGVFNVESQTPNAFDENDRQFATIFGRYIAMAMNILNLLVVERYRTNEQLAQTVLGELSEPLAEITELAEKLRDANLADGRTRKGLDRIMDATAKARRRVEACAAGPRTILGAEQELHRGEPDPAMIGKRVLVADDEAEIRTSVCAILSQRGCDVTVCANGGQTIDVLRAAGAEGTPFDLIVSDIKMPDRSGYEVFRAAKEVTPDTPVILMTGFGYDPHHSIVRASQEGLQSFLFKPFKAVQLVEEVKRGLGPAPLDQTDESVKPPDAPKG